MVSFDTFITGFALSLMPILMVSNFYCHGCEVAITEHLKRNNSRLWRDLELNEPSTWFMGASVLNSTVIDQLRDQQSGDARLLVLITDYERAYKLAWGARYAAILWVILVLIVETQG